MNELSETERQFLLGLAHSAVTSTANGTALPHPPFDQVPPACRESKACFVTLTKHDKLRGCIGNVIASEPLSEAVV
jgi:AMMECR1 domain-containing protein